MIEPYTPTTEQIRAAYIEHRDGATYSPSAEQDRRYRDAGGAAGEFDRWFESHAQPTTGEDRTVQVPVSLDTGALRRVANSEALWDSDASLIESAADEIDRLRALLSQPNPTAEPSEDDEGRIRRDERMRWAIYLWGMDEDTDGPEGAFEEGADMAYHAVAAWLLADIARGFRVSDMPWLDPDLITDAKAKARLLPSHPDSEVHEVDRCIAVLATIRDVTPPSTEARS